MKRFAALILVLALKHWAIVVPPEAVAGGLVGGVAGSGVGGRREGIIVGVLGAVAGAVAGNAIERTATREDAVEILLQLRNGDRRAIVQARGNEILQAGDAVILVTTGGKTRVTKAPGTR